MKLNKKIIGIFSLAAILALAGCGAASENNDTNQGANQPQQNEQQNGTTGGNANVAFDEAKAKETYQASCQGCHGANLEGGFGPALNNVGSKMDANAIYDIIKKGRGQMPPQGQVSDEDAKNVAEWLASLK
ncbi:MAG: hypothetical protein BAA01_15075 [Bacillus thermozeamaize]|uniref:Cytochrome c domain-containing protein n=1 Tax=Bacillus thermozeamaize TaxID=230954 RepID=A0A1Y3PEY8_9BACI|nr:MAG: hypothetical protein BAA01_15075 [Bacillus thermozeamaize]